MKNKSKTLRIKGGQLNTAQLKDFFLTHLNRIFCAKAHLQERLPELADHANFKDLEYGILETLEDIAKQIARVEEIYVLLGEMPSLASCKPLIEFIEAAFNPIYQESSNPALRDLSILFYMSVLESVELASFQLLQLVSNTMPNKQIKQLLNENFDEAKADRKLFSQITASYIS